jgi:hypothetical protein
MFRSFFGSLICCFVVNTALGSNVLKETARGPDTAITVLNAEAAIMAFDGGALPGANVGLHNRISDPSPLYLGAELGFFVATGATSYAELPLLGSLYYQFEPTAVVHPLLGFMAGPVITTGGGYSAL